jgi:carboxymethylenebutenolidase
MSPADYTDPGTPSAAREAEHTLTADDGARLRLFVAEPEAGMGAGAVLIIHDIWGYTDFYKDLARRIAAQGFVGILVDLFSRQGDLPKELRFPERTGPGSAEALAMARDRAARLSDERVLADVEAAVRHLHQQGAPKVALWGFCWGGRLAYLAAARVKGLAGCVAYYGFLRGSGASAIDLADQFSVPVLGIFGGADPGIPADQIQEFENRLKKAGKDHETVTYAGAPHGFLRYDGKRHEAAVREALQKTFAFLKRTVRTA